MSNEISVPRMFITEEEYHGDPRYDGLDPRINCSVQECDGRAGEHVGDCDQDVFHSTEEVYLETLHYCATRQGDGPWEAYLVVDPNAAYSRERLLKLAAEVMSVQSKLDELNGVSS